MTAGPSPCKIDSDATIFLWNSFFEPHPPFHPCREFVELYRDMSPPEPIRAEWSSPAPAGMMAPSWSLIQFDRLSDDGLRASRRAYYAIIGQVDYALGHLFGHLRANGLLETTWILCTSDHGEMLDDHGMGSKVVHLEDRRTCR